MAKYNTRGYLAKVESIYSFGDEVGSRFLWKHGGYDSERIEATIHKNKISIKRRFGIVGEGGPVNLNLEELAALDSICELWKNKREEWAAFYSSSAGYVFGGAWYYVPKGRDSFPEQRITVGQKFSFENKIHGEEFKGYDEERLLNKPVSLPNNAWITSEIWRVGERFGDKNGEQVGITCQTNNLCVKVKRMALYLHSEKDWTTLEHDDEEEFIHDLVLLAKKIN